MLEEENKNLSSKSVYAFAGWIASIISYVIYLLWALLPDEMLQSFGLTYYPTRFYAVAMPAYLLCFVVTFGMAYHGSCLLMTPPPEDMVTIRDKHAVSPALSISASASPSVAKTASSASSLRPASSSFAAFTAQTGGQIPDQYDLDPRLVSKVLASSRQELCKSR